jgi:hypothetical protein
LVGSSAGIHVGAVFNTDQPGWHGHDRLGGWRHEDGSQARRTVGYADRAGVPLECGDLSPQWSF